MPPLPQILAIDQGTTSTRAILFDAAGAVKHVAQRPLRQHYPQPGWVEHDPEEIWQSVAATCREAAAAAAGPIAAIGIANQRETTVLWERATGRPVHNAIVWQDRRTALLCERWRHEGLSELVNARTGLVIDPYFSAAKIRWLLDTLPGLAARAKAGEIAFGIPPSLLPEVRDTGADYGVTARALLGAEIPIAGVAGDQQAALIGQACFHNGMLKATYGTGAFALLNTGGEARASTHRLVTTIAYRLGGETAYALEGSIFVAGAVIGWLRDRLGLFAAAADAERLAAQADPRQRVYLVPGFAGLGAPYWQPRATGALIGLTAECGVAEIARAALEAVGYQTRDLLAATAAEAGIAIDSLRGDGGMAASAWTMQFLADILPATVERPASVESTAWGAAYAAGLARGLCPPPPQMAAQWRPQRRFTPQMAAAEREERYAGWRRAVAGVLAAAAP